MLTIREMLTTQAARYGDKDFVLYPEQKRALTYAQVAEGCGRTAQAFRALGVAPGGTVALLLPNIPEFLLPYWGAMAMGAVACPVNTLLTGPEIRYIADHCEATVLVTTAAFGTEVNRALADSGLPRLRHIVLVDDTEPATEPIQFPSVHAMSSLLAQAPTAELPPANVSPQTLAQIIYTSGTTGHPKGVMLSHANLLANARTISGWFGWTDATRLMCILPLFHVNGEVVTMVTPWFMGGSVVLNRRFSASTFWTYIRDYGVNAFSIVPTILGILNQQGLPEGGVPPSLQLGICGAAPLPVEVHKQFEALFQVPIFEGYGLSESTCYSTFNPPDRTRRKLGTIGVAVGNEVAIWDEHDQPVPPGVEGEIVIRGENVMLGYFQRPDTTAEAMRGGWFHSGDWGVMDEAGFFAIRDRVKDLIIRGGENISPREIDEVLYQHPAVSAAATIGVPDPKYGEEVKSFVVLKPGEAASEADLLAYCREHLAAFKCPKAVAFIDEIPKGPTGKLLRRALRALDAGAQPTPS